MMMTRRTLLSTFALAPLIAAAGPASAAQASLAPVLGARGAWLNGRATAHSLAGRVVLVDVFTFECVNCVRVTPNLQAIYRAHSRDDLAIVAVHSPEVPSYQARLSYVADQARAAKLRWPIVLDNDLAIWNAYGVDAWPTQLIFGRDGKLAARIVGDSQDGAVDRAIAAALRA